MNTPVSAIAGVIDARRSVLRLCAIVARPIGCPQTSLTTMIRDQR
jgi:hypothetical protein